LSLTGSFHQLATSSATHKFSYQLMKYAGSYLAR